MRTPFVLAVAVVLGACGPQPNTGGTATPPPAAPGQPAVGSATDLNSFQGARAGQAEMGIQNLGYQSVRTEGLTSYWLNASTGACAEITTANGVYETVNMVSTAACGGGGTAAAQLPATPAADSATDLSSFQGARAGQAEMGVENLGYEIVRSDGSTNFWFNRATGECAAITTLNGIYETVTMLPAGDC